MASKPTKVAIRTYQVGFGDCFLLSFQYKGAGEKHVLIDFGTTKLPPKAPKSRMMDIAADIKKRTGNRLHAVVATHRHQDHISGFATAKGKGSGDVIKALKPSYVVQPWTEDPALAPDATGPNGKSAKKPTANHKHIASLAAMHDVARQSYLIGRNARYLGKDLRDQLSFLGEDNIGNPSAVRNLMTMAAGKKNQLYLKAGDPAVFDRELGIKVHVLGPPTVDQHAAVAKQRARDPDEFWQLRGAAAAGATTPLNRHKGPLLFPRYVRSLGPGYPIETRWLVFHARNIQGDQLLQIVRDLDKAMNNTSVVLLFEIGNTRLLFPGDAQIENWEYALSDDATQKLLSGVNLYKVGHHGSLNATPVSLWKLFKNKSPTKSDRRLAALMSTLEHKHGREKNDTEVPRRTLVATLERNTNLFSTQQLTDPKDFYHDSELDL